MRGKLDVLLDSPGDDIDAAYNTAQLLRRYGTAELNVSVPRWAKSEAGGDVHRVTSQVESVPRGPQPRPAAGGLTGAPRSCYREAVPMAARKVESLIQDIKALSDAERQELAREVLPWLLATRAGLEEIDRSLEALPDDELDALIERARARAGELGDDAVSAIVEEAVRAVRAQGRP